MEKWNKIERRRYREEQWTEENWKGGREKGNKGRR